MPKELTADQKAAEEKRLADLYVCPEHRTAAEEPSPAPAAKPAPAAPAPVAAKVSDKTDSKD